MFDALDRKDDSKPSDTVGAKSTDINYRDEPVAFFFVLYGIAFEALVTIPGSNSQDSRDQTLEILVALKKILRPSVAGNAIYQDVVFSETMDVFDRLAQTEGIAVQAAIVEITRNLCLSHPSVDEEAGDEHLSDDIEQLFELIRIIVLVLAGVLPNLGEKQSPPRHQLSPEAVSLITVSLDALVDAADVFPSIIRTDLHACIIHIFTTILGTGACQAVVVPRALPLFKRFVQALAEDSSLDQNENPHLSDQLRICLSRFRAILFNAQRRESEASLQCARNTLMTTVILLTNGAGAISPTEPLVEKLLADLLDCLPDLGLGKVAANCTRSLLLIDQKSTTSQTITRFLLPRLLHFVSTDDTQQPDPESAKPIIVSALITYLASLYHQQQSQQQSTSSDPTTATFPTFLSILLPLLLHRASFLGKDSYADAATKLLQIAGLHQGAFKGVVEAMGAEARGMLEEVIRVGGGAGGAGGKGRDGGDGGEGREPSIALKMRFG